MFIMDSLDVVSTNVNVGGCFGYLEKDIFRDDGSGKMCSDDGQMMVLREEGYLSRRGIYEKRFVMIDTWWIET